jgi:hypothetical protein
MIIITGSGRSGTSAVARLVHESGLSVGHDLIDADESNAEGYFEERPVITVNDHILGDAAMKQWFAVATREQLLAAARGHEDEMRALIRSATPAWKDPRFCWTLEAWMELMYLKPRLIVCLRSPAEVVASTLKYYGQVSDEARRHVEHRWQAEYERLLEVIEDYALDAITVEYGALHTDPARAVMPVGHWLCRRLDASGVRADLRHHAAPVPGALQPLYERVRALGNPTTAEGPRAGQTT